MNLKDRIKQRAKERTTGNVGGGIFDFDNAGVDNVEFWAPDNEGPFTFDIIPYGVTDSNNLDEVPADEEWYRKLLLVHYNVGPSKKKVVCPRTVGRACPICEAVREAYDSGNDEEAKIIKAKEKGLMNIVLEGEDEIKLFLSSTFLFGKPLEREAAYSDIYNFASPTDGLSIKVRFEEKSIGTNSYYETERIDFVERDNQFDEAIVNEAYPLDDIIRVLSYEELEKALYGAEVESMNSNENSEDDNSHSVKDKIKISTDNDEEEDDIPYGNTDGESDGGDRPSRPKRPVRRKR